MAVDCIYLSSARNALDGLEELGGGGGGGGGEGTYAQSST